MDMGLWSNLPIRLAPAPGYAALPRASYGLASSGLAKSWRFGSEERRRRGRTQAHGASRGYSNTGRSSPGGAKQPQQPTCSVSVSPLRGSRIIPSRFPQLAPWAQVLSRLRRFSETPSTDTGNVTTGTDTGNVTTGTDTGNFLPRSGLVQRRDAMGPRSHIRTAGECLRSSDRDGSVERRRVRTGQPWTRSLIM